MEEKRNHYCRACGGNKGHNFSSCTNARGLREIIRLQDGQIDSERNYQNRIDELEKQLKTTEGNATLVHRVMLALLDAYELVRAEKK